MNNHDFLHPECKKMKLELIATHSNGRFSAQLNTGRYVVNLSECNFLGCSSKMPITISIEAGKTTTLEIDIDTGIR
jgi:hypothetical protein